MTTELEFNPIARRELWLNEPTGPHPVIVELARPVPHPEGDFACPFRIEGLGDSKTRYAAGVDEIQSLLLALKLIGTILHTSDENQQSRLKSLDDEGSLGFPLPSNLSDLYRGHDRTEFLPPEPEQK
jgi:hypothetical protein